jgi:hypothetical protein
MEIFARKGKSWVHACGVRPLLRLRDRCAHAFRATARPSLPLIFHAQVAANTNETCVVSRVGAGRPYYRRDASCPVSRAS